MKIKMFKLLFLLVFISIFWWVFDYSLSYLSFDAIQAQKADWESRYQQSPAVFAVYFFVAYVLLTGLSIPGAALMGLLSGWIFGLWYGVLLVSFASTVGATLAFLSARFILRDWIQKKYSRVLQKINSGLEHQGKTYLLSLRLIPLFPFFLVNLLMGLTRMPVFAYMWVSQLGMLPGSLLFVNAGTQLAQIERLEDVFSIALWLSFLVLGLLPLISKNFLQRFQQYQQLRGFAKPTAFDRNLVVIGAGAGGLVSAYIAAMLKAKVSLIEQHKMGGDCLNTGCVPSKALIQAAKLNYQMQHADQYGLRCSTAEVDFPRIMQRVHHTIAAIAPNDSITRYQRLGVDVISGKARILSPYCVEVNGQRISTRQIIIASGAKPAIPQLPGLQNTDYITSDTLWELTQLPQRLLILGAGAIGCEMAQAFARLGSRVVLISRAAHILPGMDQEAVQRLQQQFNQEQISIHLNTRIIRIENGSEGSYALCEAPGQATLSLVFDKLLLAVGRQTVLDDLCTETMKLELSSSGFIHANAFLQTNYPNIYVAGDVSGLSRLTHSAASQAWIATVNALFGRFKRFRFDPALIPQCVFTDPEMAMVGLTQQMADQQNIPYEVTCFELNELDRIKINGHPKGIIKVLTVPGNDKILGVTIAGEQAGELIHEYVLAMHAGWGLSKLLKVSRAYPTLMEANKYLAAKWKQQHTPDWIFSLLKRFQDWQRN